VTYQHCEVSVKPLNVLITAASRRVPLLRAFKAALRDLGVQGRVLVTDVNRLSPAVHLADRWHEVPLASDPGYIDAILAICRTEGIVLVIPTIDDELVLFGQARSRFDACGVRVAVSPTLTSCICNDKYRTSISLRAAGVAAAETFLPDQLTGAPVLPLFIKPRFGRGGVGAFPVTSRRHLEFFLEYVGEPIIQEYLEGPEFTIDMLCDFTGRPLAIVPRERVVIRAGVIDRGRTVHDPALIELAQLVARVLPFFGPVNIQCRVVSGRPVVFEINPRFSGGIPLTIAAGADFPRMLLQLARGQRVLPAIGAFRHGLWMSNYEETVFLEPDGATGDMRLAQISAAVAVGDVA
jgi:carbamoyl-phosphate synthase large subunit